MLIHWIILWNIEISYNKQNIVFQLACFIRIIQMFLSF